MADEELLEGEDSKKKKKEKKKKNKKGENFDAVVGDGGTLYTDADEEEEGGGLLSAVIVVFIVVIWLAILALLVKLDVGGFGSGVLYPVFKDVPLINKILPDNIDEELEQQTEFASLDEALEEITRLRARVKELEDGDSSRSEASSEEVAALKEEIRRLQTFEDSQIEFQKLKTEFYEEVVFSDSAPSVEEYKKYYEEIDPDNAEYIYRQVVKQIETDKDLERYVKTYSSMKPKQAAAIFEQMTDNLNLVAGILKEMDTDARAKILGVMDSEVAAQLTKILDPDY